MTIRAALLACTAALLACSASEKVFVPGSTDAAATAVSTFTHLADSVSNAGGDTTLSHSYATLAEAIRQGGRVSPVVITIDGAATEFLATAQLTEFTLKDSTARTTSLRSFIAFNATNPKQIVQLTSAADSEPIRAYIYPTFAAFPGPSASLVYMDGTGGSFFGTSGSQKVGVLTSSVSCTAAAGQPKIAIYPTTSSCTNADFTVGLDSKAEASQFLVKNNTATGSHTLAMASQKVLGARFQFSVPVPLGPPVVVKPSATLPATLTAKVDSLVNLTLTVTNPTSAPVQVNFSSGQHNDFTISDLNTGELLWRAGMGMMFTQVASTQTLAPGASLTFTGYWKPTRKGSLVAVGELVSASHTAAAKALVTIP